MQFSVNQNLLLSNLNKVSRVTPARTTMPILNSILFMLKNSNLTLRASDIEITLSTTFQVNGQEDGSIAVPSRIIQEIVSEIREGELTFVASEEGEIKISAGKGKYKIMGRPGEEFPSLPNITNQSNIVINGKILSRIIQKTVFAVGKDELKPSMTGVLFEVKHNELISVATDGHRLVYINRRDFSSPEYERQIIVPVKFLNLINTYLTDDNNVNLIISENHIMMESNSTLILSRIIDERFPDYESVIPKDNDKLLVADVDYLSTALKRVSIFSNKTTHQISVNLNRETSKISTVDLETMSSADEILDVNYDGEDMAIGFNAEYLREIVRNIDTKQVMVKLKTPVSASLVLPENQEENEELIMLLMPIRLSE
ncbi:MAG TPA: DNA polymerase III subunit beta [Candidatus Marinimicrobia bacterium]|nr:DNA polymerase III subunit beta [Candidatus Neomarinimicrobiota bacterium]HRS50854.1 DNA polymerase III subunit beta [Candidatus Neomarinimicrobiota bacterium]HRU91804.1 DNA polymerase III subunit beta [Candidatus Neomarinimicrobiota bacterium]